MFNLSMPRFQTVLYYTVGFYHDPRSSYSTDLVVITVGRHFSWRPGSCDYSNCGFYPWLVVWNISIIFPFSWEFHHPN